MNELDHSLREELIGELHARPFLSLETNARVSFFAATHAEHNSREEAHQRLLELCAEFDITPPKAPTNYFVAEFEGGLFKWESHTEFVSFLIFERNRESFTFGSDGFEHFPKDWRRHFVGRVLVRLVIEIPPVDAGDVDVCIEPYREMLRPESLAVAGVLEERAVVATDFQVDENGNVRILLIPRSRLGPKRIGRIVQRLAEIEVYKTFSLMALPNARELGKMLPGLENNLLELMNHITNDEQSAPDEALDDLLALSKEVEQIITSYSGRFSASFAYSDIVSGRIAVLRESRVAGFQLFSEFMLRRYDPSMRTIESTWNRTKMFSKRLERAAHLLSTRVDVKNADSQKALLASMNKRAELQLRLQETVEGFSVVAISYYSLSLLGYFLTPVSKAIGIDKAWLIGAAVIPTIILVYLFVNRVKHKVVEKL